MDSKNIKIRVNLNTREFEVEGDQEAVFKNFGDLLKDYLDLIKHQPTKQNDLDKRGKPSSVSQTNNLNDDVENEISADSFGEFYNKFSKTLSNVDKLLIASYFVQSKSDNKSFTVKEANDLLVEQGIKLSNPNAFNKSNSDTKRVFKLSGKNYRVSDNGIESIKSIGQQ